MSETYEVEIEEAITLLVGAHINAEELFAAPGCSPAEGAEAHRHCAERHSRLLALISRLRSHYETRARDAEMALRKLIVRIEEGDDAREMARRFRVMAGMSASPLRAADPGTPDLARRLPPAPQGTFDVSGRCKCGGQLARYHGDRTPYAGVGEVQCIRCGRWQWDAPSPDRSLSENLVAWHNAGGSEACAQAHVDAVAKRRKGKR